MPSNISTWKTLVALCLLTTTCGFASEPTPGYNHEIPEKIMTPDSVETRIGTLKFFDGMPDDATVQMAYDNLDFMRGVDVFPNFIPATSIEGIRLGMAEMGATQSNQVLVMDSLLHSAPLFLTGNTDTVYASVMLDLKRDGPTVVETMPCLPHCGSNVAACEAPPSTRAQRNRTVLITLRPGW